MHLLLTQDVEHSCGKNPQALVTIQYVPRSWCSAQQLKAWDELWRWLLSPTSTAEASEELPPAVAQEPRQARPRRRQRRK
jgi:hypothetical protein